MFPYLSRLARPPRHLISRSHVPPVIRSHTLQPLQLHPKRTIANEAYQPQPPQIDLSPTSWAKIAFVIIAGVLSGGAIAIQMSDLLEDLDVFVYTPDPEELDERGDGVAQARGRVEEVTFDSRPPSARINVGVEAGGGEAGSETAPVGGMDLAEVFGDFKMRVSFNWATEDASYVTISKSKIATTLEDLEEAIKLKKPEGLALKEAELTVNYLKDSLYLHDARLAQIHRKHTP